MSTFFTRLLNLAEKKQASCAEEYAGLVRNIADGKDVDPGKALATCEKVGRAPKDLEGAVDLLTRRRQARADLNRAIKAEADSDQLHQQVNEIRLALDQSISRLKAEAWAKEHPLLVRLDELKPVIDRKAGLESFLNQTSQTIDAGLETRQTRRMQLNQERSKLGEDLCESERIKRDALSDARHATIARESGGNFKDLSADMISGKMPSEYVAIGTEAEAKSEALKSEIAAIDEALAALDMEQQQVEADRLLVA